MGPNGDLRQLEANELPRADEILVPPEDLPKVEEMNRQQRRAYYREQKKKGGSK